MDGPVPVGTLQKLCSTDLSPNEGVGEAESRVFVFRLFYI